MRCSNVIVPGLVESDKTKNSPLQAKMNQLLSMKNNKQSQKTHPQGKLVKQEYLVLG
jgi:hypothetical protein